MLVHIAILNLSIASKGRNRLLVTQRPRLRSCTLITFGLTVVESNVSGKANELSTLRPPLPWHMLETHGEERESRGVALTGTYTVRSTQ